PTQDIEIEVQPPSGENPPEGSFTIKVKMGSVAETFDNVNLGKRGTKNVAEAVAQASKLITIVEEQTAGTIAERIPEVGSYLIKSHQLVIAPKLLPLDFSGNVEERSGFEGLQIADDVTMVCCPDLMSAYQ